MYTMRDYSEIIGMGNSTISLTAVCKVRNNQLYIFTCVHIIYTLLVWNTCNTQQSVKHWYTCERQWSHLHLTCFQNQHEKDYNLQGRGL